MAPRRRPAAIPLPAQKFVALHAFAVGRDTNPRNLEHHWYGYWQRQLNVWTDRLRAVVMAQFPLWHTDDADVNDQNNHDDAEGPGDEGGLEDIPEFEEEEHGDDIPEELEGEDDNPHEHDDEPRGDDGQGREESEEPDVLPIPEANAEDENNISAATLPGRADVSRFPDFAILVFKRRGNKTISIMPCHLLEVKHAPSRRLKGAAILQAVAIQLCKAKLDLVEQVICFFLQYPNENSVHGVVIAGLFWSMTRFTRNMVAGTLVWNTIAQSRDPAYIPLEAARVVKLKFPKFDPTCKIDTPASARRVLALQANVRRAQRRL